MTLPVPLTVRVGDKHVTRQVQSLSFRREAVGGVRSISFSLARPLLELAGVDPLASVYVYDGRTAKTVAQGRLADTGRSANVDGQRWECVAFGPAQHLSDVTTPLIYVERSISDGWVRVNNNTPNASIGTAPNPTDTSVFARQGILASFAEGENIDPFARATLEYRRIYDAGQKIARVAYNWDSGITSADWYTSVIMGTGGTSATTVGAAAANTGGGSTAVGVITNWANVMDTCRIEFVWTNAATVVAPDTWAWFDDVVIRSVLMTANSVELTGAYANYVLAYEVVNDLLGRLLGQFDRANNTIVNTSGSTQIWSLAYPDGVTPEQVLSDLMEQEPAFRWYTTPDFTGGGYGFRWDLWPTTVRYEATLDDGGSFPVSTQGLYNQVRVRWVDLDGSSRWTLRTKPCAILDASFIVRQAQIDLGSELGSSQAAAAAGDAFLAEHNVPKNSGTLTVARPIRDVLTGAMVQPWEIEAGELVRIKGVEAYPDAFNAATNDGQGVFRIFAVDYTTEGNTATLALDSDPRETEDALVKLLNQRTRR